MSRFVHRDQDGVLVGHYANPNPLAQEEVADDHEDILAWNEKRQADRDASAARKELLASMTPEILMAKILALEAEVAALKESKG